MSFGRFIVIIAFLCVSLPVFAAGPMINIVDDSGDVRIDEPPTWDNSEAISYHPESGSCGPFSNAEMISKFATDLSVWSSIDTVDISFSGVTDIVGSLDDTNYEDYLYVGSTTASNAEDEINPVVFDDDGSIVAAIFGDGNKYSVLGFASVNSYSADGVIIDGQAVINCKCLADHPDGACEVLDLVIEDTEDDLDFTIVHEMGHFLNLGHSNVNSDLFVLEENVEGDMPIMFPIASGMTTITPHPDDELALTMLYPKADITDDYCLVEGYLVDSSGSNYAPCVDVWAVADSGTTETLSYTTASMNNFNTGTDDFDSSATCDKYCGYFALYVKAETAYTLKAYDVYPTFIGGSGVGPCSDEQPEYGLTGETLLEIADTECTVPSTEAIDAGTIKLGITIEGGSSSSDDDSGKSGGDSKGGSGGSGGVSNPTGYMTCSLGALGTLGDRSSVIDDHGNFFFFNSMLALCLIWLIMRFMLRTQDKLAVAANKSLNKYTVNGQRTTSSE